MRESLCSLVCPGLCLAINPSFQVAIDTPQRPVVMGLTNLPDGTALLITISRKQSSFRAQSTAKVMGGKFRSEQFSQKGKDLNAGEYKLEVSMGVAQVQTPQVRAVIGMEGEKMIGSLVQRGRYGPTINYVTTFLAGGIPSDEADKAARAKEKENVEAWTERSCRTIVALRLMRAGAGTHQAEMAKCIREHQGKES